MNRLTRTAQAIACALVLSAGYGAAAQGVPGPRAPPAPAPGHFAGKFELVPLFDRGKPVIRNGHQYMALRNTISFRRPNGEMVSMPAGMTTDLASDPSILWPLLPPDGPYAEATIPHDLCFKSKGSFVWFAHQWRDRPAPYSRAECNEIFREGMVALGVPAWRRIVMFEGVQAGRFLAPGAWGS